MCKDGFHIVLLSCVVGGLLNNKACVLTHAVYCHVHWLAYYTTNATFVPEASDARKSPFRKLNL